MRRSKAIATIAVLWTLTTLATLAFAVDDGADETQVSEPVSSKAESGDRSRPYRTESVRGKVVWLAAALEQHFGITSVPEAAERSLALVTPQGEVLPLVENLRGRAFRKDERLRGKEMELVVRRYHHQPLVQVLKIYEFDKGDRFEVDYWCDVCAIVMFETGPCSCCQDHNRLRKRIVKDPDR